VITGAVVALIPLWAPSNSKGGKASPQTPSSEFVHVLPRANCPRMLDQAGRRVRHRLDTRPRVPKRVALRRL
jgi:hypothetical protein